MGRWLACALAAGIVSQASIAGTQDPLVKAKEFYAAAAYDEALQALATLSAAGKSEQPVEVAAYRVFCLVALARQDEAKRAAEALVRLDPLYRPNDAQVSPRVRTFFESVRAPLLPGIVRQTYAKGKDAFDHKDMPAASAEFDRVLAILDQMPSDDQSVADLRTLASGFRDLSKTAPPPAPEPPKADPAPAPAPPPVLEPRPIPIYTAADQDVKAPVAISNKLPPWYPANPVEALREFRGTLELVIAEDGHVISAALTKGVNAAYDPTLLKAAQKWTYQPATKAGVPVRFRMGMDVRLGK